MTIELEKNEMMNVFYQRSKEHGLKITPQPTAIYQELMKAKDHPTADDIYKRIAEKIPNICDMILIWIPITILDAYSVTV